MTLPSSGPISLSQIQTEFGGSDPISLTEYYRGGAYTTDNNTGVPTSGAISMAGDFYGTVRAVAMTYEIIGAGGGGGAGDTSTANGSAGGSSSFSGTGITTVTSSGGAGGPGHAQTGWGDGENSYYGNGGAGGFNSDSNNQSGGFAPAATAYGAGGGGGGAHTFAERNGGIGGYAGGTDGAGYTVTAWNSGSTLQRYVGMPSTGTINVTPGQTVNVTIGAGGAGGGGFTSGAKGADGYARFVVGGQTFEYTAAGNYSFTVPS